MRRIDGDDISSEMLRMEKEILALKLSQSLSASVLRYHYTVATGSSVIDDNSFKMCDVTFTAEGVDMVPMAEISVKVDTDTFIMTTSEFPIIRNRLASGNVRKWRVLVNGSAAYDVALTVGITSNVPGSVEVVWI